jgi:hypothetical protein
VGRFPLRSWCVAASVAATAENDHSLRHQEVELLRGALGALGTRFSRVALEALVETCRELRLPSPTLPP